MSGYCNKRHHCQQYDVVAVKEWAASRALKPLMAAATQAIKAEAAAEDDALGNTNRKHKAGKVTAEEADCENFGWKKDAKGKGRSKANRGEGGEDEKPEPESFAMKRSAKGKKAHFDEIKKQEEVAPMPLAPPVPKHANSAAEKLGQVVPIVVRLENLWVHPEAKKMMVCTLDMGAARPSVQVVCGGTNLREGMCTVLAPVGSSINTPQGPMTIKPVKLRGIDSHGMLCGEGELGLLAPGISFPTEVVELAADIELGAAFEVLMLRAISAVPAKNWLTVLLDECSLNDKLALAEAWCTEQGVMTYMELLKPAIAQEFAQALVLKPTRETILLKRLVSGQKPGWAVSKPLLAKTVTFTTTALAIDAAGEKVDAEPKQFASSGAKEVLPWILDLDIPHAAAAAYANELCAHLGTKLTVPPAAELGMTTLRELNVKRGHAILLSQELRLAQASALAKPLAVLPSWLEKLGMREARARQYGATLGVQGMRSRKAFEHELEAGTTSFPKLAALGILRGHILLLLHDFRHLMLPSLKKDDVGPPIFEFGATRAWLRGPLALGFPPDDALPIISLIQIIKTAKPPPASAWAELATEEAEFDFDTLAMKPKKHLKDEMSVPGEPMAELDFGAKPNKKKFKKELAVDQGAEFTFAPVVEATIVPVKQKKQKKQKSIANNLEDDAHFEFGLHACASPSKEKQGQTQMDKNRVLTTEELQAQRAKEDMETLLAELDEPKVQGGGIKFSLSMMHQGETDEGAMGALAAEAESIPPTNKDKKKKKKKKGVHGVIAEKDDEMVLLDAAMAEAAALRGDDSEGPFAKNDKENKVGASDDEAEMTRLNMTMTNTRSAMSHCAEELVDEHGDERADTSADDGKLTKAQKKKLRVKAKKAVGGCADEGDEGVHKEDKKKPRPKIAQMLREEQERRALEEAALTLAAELTEEAQRLFKSLDVLALGDKALRRLDSAEVSGQVAKLVARAECAAAEHPQFEKVLSVASAVQDLQVAMDTYLVAEEKRRLRREKEKERKERLRDEGKLLSATERAKRAKQEAYLQSLQESGGALPGDQGGEDGEKKKRVNKSKSNRRRCSPHLPCPLLDLP